MKKSLAPIALAAALAGGAGALAFAPGFAGAQVSNGAAAADPADPKATGGPVKSVLDGLVADGTLTQAQADTVLSRLKDVLPGHKGRPHAALAAAGADVASYLGLSAQEIRTALKGGKTLADLATQQGKSVDGLVGVIVAAETKAIDTAVTNGRLTADRAAALKGKLAERTKNFVENGLPIGPLGRGGRPAPAASAPA
jgi:polyhydroxyalkanoate synthesis regulator phasin